jgi:hypothetical protein
MGSRQLSPVTGAACVIAGAVAMIGGAATIPAGGAQIDIRNFASFVVLVAGLLLVAAGVFWSARPPSGENHP